MRQHYVPKVYLKNFGEKNKHTYTIKVYDKQEQKFFKVETLQNIGKHYQEGEIEIKRAIIGSIFPEKLEFDGKHYRTA